jgi:c-di-GMP-binding flagellar brake protein YcgR
MELSNNRRAYKRDINFCNDAKVSLDGVIWHDALVFDISAGGVKFITNILFDIGDDLWFELEVPEFLDKQEVVVKGKIRRQENDEQDKFVYGVSFEEMTDAMKINIDESIMFKEKTHNFIKKKKTFSTD